MSRPADPPGVPARRASLRLLDAVLRQGLPLETALENAARGLQGPDRFLALAIAGEVLRRLPDLDALIDSATRQPLAPDAKARGVLRIALVQAITLGTPPHAAIATALPLVEGGPRRLVHGVFGTLMRGGARLPEVPTLPAAVAERWQTAWGAATVASAARSIAVPPPLDLSLSGDTPHELEGTSFAPGHLRLERGHNVAELPGFAEGRWWVQDISASLPARLIGRGPGVALDLCAAPGGKTMQLAASGWQVKALDASKSRLARLRENLARTGLQAEVTCADLLRWQPPEPADAILLDAPCSATGIFRRHPDVLHRVRPAAIPELAAGQAAMLARAADWLKPGGVLVYAVCSLEPEEGEAVARAFLDARSDYRIDPVSDGEVPAEIPRSDEGWLRLLPGLFADRGGADSFFIVRFRRN